MPKKKTVSIGKDVLQSGKKLLPKKAELTIKPPLLPLELKFFWEQKESGKISDEEFRRILKNFKSKSKKQERTKKRYHKSTAYV